jgi:hypothetical protein
MRLRLQALRLLAKLLWTVSWPAALLAAVAAILSFRMPEIALIDLYRWSLITNRVGMGAILVNVVLGLCLHWLEQPFSGVTRRAREAWGRHRLIPGVAQGVLLALFVSVFLAMFRFVHPEASKWISTGRAGPTEVSAAVARLYLWRLIRMDALFLLGAAWILGGYSWGLLAGILQVEASREEWVPTVVTHVRPRDYRS